MTDEFKLEEKTELGEVFDNLDRDVVDKETRMSGIDFNTKLHDLQISNIMVIDEFTRLGIFPEETGITRQIKRLSISKEGWGREGKVRIVVGNREQENAPVKAFSSLFKRRD